MDTASKALLVLLQDQGKRRDRTHKFVHIAQRTSPELARRMRSVLRAQRDLDDYVDLLLDPNVAKAP